MPDRFLRTQLAESATGKAAADGKRQGDELTGDECGPGDRCPDNRAGVGSANQTDEEWPLEREIRRVVAEQDP